MGRRPKTRVGQFLRAYLRSDPEWKDKARLYIAICPHLGTLPPRHQYSCVKKIRQRLRRDPFVLLIFLLGIAAVFVGVELFCDHLPASVREFLNMGGTWAFVVVMLTWSGLIAAARWIAAEFMPNRLRRIVRECVNEYSDVQICTDCGYDLRAQTVPRCPECGQPIDPPARSP